MNTKDETKLDQYKNLIQKSATDQGVTVTVNEVLIEEHRLKASLSYQDNRLTDYYQNSIKEDAYLGLITQPDLYIDGKKQKF